MNPKPFIPAWLDELGLPQSEFRVLCHLWRRADAKGRSFPGAASIRRCCRVSENTLWSSLRSLESRGLIVRGKYGQHKNYYVVIVPPATASGVVTKENGSPQKVEGLSPQSERQQPPQSIGQQPPQKVEGEGIPMKVIQRRVSSEGVKAVTPTDGFIPLCLTEHDAAATAADFRATDRGIQQALQAFNERKSNFRDDWPLDLVKFRGWLGSSKPGKAILAANLRPAQVAAGNIAATEIPEPHWWREAAADHVSLSVYAKGSWEAVRPEDRPLLQAAASRWLEGQRSQSGASVAES